ncbi:MAG TPA: lmo0937 family membrane protein [Segetibacter sp.]
MRSILYLIAVICVIGWVFGFFFSGGTGSTNNLIHILLVLAVIAILISVIRRA